MNAIASIGATTLTHCICAILILLSTPGHGHTQESENISLSLPAVGMWNAYQQQINILECLNFANEDIDVSLKLRSSANQEIASRDAKLLAKGSLHIILNDLTELGQAYGSFSLDAASQRSLAEQQLRCTTLVYRPSATEGEPFEYAFAVPLDNPIKGNQFGLYNSINPSQTQTPVFNWLTVFNSGDEPFAAILELREFDGASKKLQRIGPLAAGERVDIALGHNETEESPQSVGLYRILPDDSEQEFISFLSRYGSQEAAFDFAFALKPSPGSCNLSPLFASTIGNARNWLEVANSTANRQSTEVTVFGAAGELLHTELFSLEAFAQKHIFLNEHLGDEQVGSVRISCEGNEDGALLAQTMFYGRQSRETESIRWAYGMQDNLPATDPATRLVNSGNTFFGAANWIRFLATDENLGTARIRFASANGERTEERSVSILANATADVPVHEFLGIDQIGSSSLETSGGSLSFVAETLRVFLSDDGSIQYILNTPSFLLPRGEFEIEQEPFVSGLSGPVYLTHSGDGSGKLYVIERAGKVKVVENATILTEDFLDIRTLVGLDGEQGLHSIAFHPNYETNGFFFIHYNNKSGDTQIVRYQRDNDDPNTADPSSGKLIYSLEQPDPFHNGGQIAFGPDGFLYIALGDGGFAGDPLGNGQDTSNALGSVLRIDVDQGDPYTIPNDNPFVDNDDIPSEVFAFGFRNPWRFSFDSENGRLFLGDVGQNDIEEVDLVESGKNYGWSTMEGSRCFKPTENCDTTGLTLPISEYSHAEGNSIIGGYVYRGNEIAELQGKYLFGDFSSGRIWTLTENEDSTWQRDQLYKSEDDIFISSFGEDEAGELYIIEITGAISKIRRK